MAHRKSGGSAKSLRDSNPSYRGIKLYAGEKVKQGQIIVRQVGSKILAGKNVGVGSDYTLFAKTNGIVDYKKKRKTKFTGKYAIKSIVDVIN